MSRSSSRSLFPYCMWGFALVGVVLISVAPAIAVAGKPDQPFAAAAVFPPWWDRARVEAAVVDFGVVTGHGRFGAVVSVTGGAQLEQQLKQAGAWAVLDPRFAGCNSNGT
ncbi:hypothetical protein ACO2Q1_09470 [Brevundimonas sp. VNH65]|uniref:hypothetical protein n=1 Tax=Brevundimonas sp. VNH65 TaxID=3400917 RepID=UPI003C038B7F